ncbi:MAG: (E)-4-hydroxy-3-methylbut-2-enyl-diphosphate synthase [Treponema sp.]
MYKSKKITIGGNGITRKLEIGGNAPISIQTMWKESLLVSDLHDVALKLEKLRALGCDIVRFAVPDAKSGEVLVKLSYLTSMPLVADIHFDHHLALLCMEGNVAKIRINPGNIGSEKNVIEVVKKASDKGVALRIGVNSGSLPKDLVKRLQMSKESNNKDFSFLKARAMAEAAFRELEILDKLGFERALVSIKASNVKETILANEAFRAQRNEPLHLGVTEAGPLVSGIVKSSIAFSKLFEQGIGETIRVSLSDTMENEVLAAREILSECGKREECLKLVSCPRCGRRGFDVHSFVARWQHRLFAIKKDVTVAIMGCVVNGPGEASMADLGITGSPEMVVIFKKGVPIRNIKLKDVSNEMRDTIIDEAFEKELNEL